MMKHGDYTELADHYARYRPGYSPVIRDLLLALPGPPVNELNIADVGAGTGIWTRMMAEKSPASLVAVEPNDPMRKKGKANEEFSEIAWRDGSAEATSLEDQSLHMLPMASLGRLRRRYCRVLARFAVWGLVYRLVEPPPP